MKKLTGPIMFWLVLLLAGCGVRVLPQEALREVDPSVDFAQIKENPQRYEGATLLLGGQIVQNRATPSGSVLEILKYTLDRGGYPQGVDEGAGRFLVRSDRFLDPKIYEEERLITLTGTFVGMEKQPLQGVEYAYPVFRLGSAHVWRSPDYYPGFYSPYAYPPLYRPYWYDPFWYDPLWYPVHPGYRNDRFWYR